MTSEEFQNSSLQKRWEYLEDMKFYIASRSYRGFRVDLHYTGELFVEVWKKLGLNQIYWIELSDQEKALKDYVDLDLG